LSRTRSVIFCVLFAALSCFQLSAQGGKETAKSTIDIVQDDAAFDTLHKQYLAEDALQLERPIFTPDPVDEADTRPPSNFKMPKWLVSFFEALGPILQVLFYAAIAVIAAFVLYFIFGALRQVNLQDFRKKKEETSEADDVLAASLKPDAVAARSLLEEADALAREGKFAEAVHLLLFRSIEDIQTRRKKRLSTALTAREIGELDDLPEKPRSALGPIIALVERSFFGGRDVDESGWQSARQAYENFAFGEAWT